MKRARADTKVVSLDHYARKRSFAHTPEPPPVPVAHGEGPLLFVVQQHAARRLHWDFRLEAGGVLLSWAVPGGPSLVSGEKRLAVRTEDHPFAYASFEGVIPKGQYGAGEVIVWDAGVYSPDEAGRYAFDDRTQAEQRIAAGLERGKLSVFLRGHKLKGSFALVRMKDSSEWLLIKHRDRFSRGAPPVTDADRSVLTGWTLADWKRPPADTPRMPAEQLAPRGRKSRIASDLAPMLATAAKEAFSDPQWRFEPKLDGYRALAVVEGGRARLVSRRGGLDLNTPFPELLAELADQAVETMVLDTELVAFDASGKPSFHALQNRVPGPKRGRGGSADGVGAAACVLFCFDLLYFAGVDLRSRAYDDRRRYLEQCLLPAEHLQLVHVESDGLALYAAAMEAGFEGVMAKRRDSKYESGRRSRNWLKLKRVDSGDFVVGGYTRGKGWRAAQFGALLLGEMIESGKLRYVGRVGSGFDDATLADLKCRFEPLQSDTMPFTERPEEVQGATWVQPNTVVEVRFAEVTPLGQLRAPVFVRVRDDKAAQGVAGVSRGRSRGAQRGADSAAPPTKKDEQRQRGRRRRSAEASTPLHANGSLGPVEAQEIEAVLAQLGTKGAKLRLEVQGAAIPLTNLDKVLWPADEALAQRACTKRDFLVYLARVSPYMLPHIADRPLTMIRMPDGIAGSRFFQKHYEHKLPGFVERIEVYSESKDERQEYLLCNNLPTLLWLGQIGTLEFHVWHSRANPQPEMPEAAVDYASSLQALESSILNYPDYVVFDLDPYIYSGKEKKGAEPELNAVAFERGKEVAFWLRDLMRAMALEPIVKTSGKTGLHVFLPIVRTIDFDTARAVCEAIGRHLMQQHPDAITMEWNTTKRTGKIFFDHNMNARAKTLNVAYSPRGTAGTPVSMPLTWEELEKAHPLDFRMDNVFERLSRVGDRWEDALRSKQDITRSLTAPDTKLRSGKKGSERSS